MPAPEPDFETYLALTFGTTPTTLTKTLRALRACVAAYQAVKAIDADGSGWDAALTGEKEPMHEAWMVVLRRARDELVKAGFKGEVGGKILADVQRFGA